MKNKLRSIGAALGIFTATVVITYAASSLIPTYAPGENPPSLDQAPLLYRMAGQTDPDNFDHANDSLQAIGDKLTDIQTTVDAGVGGMKYKAPKKISANNALPSDRNTCLQKWESGVMMNYFNVDGQWYFIHGSSEPTLTATCYNTGYHCYCY